MRTGFLCHSILQVPRCRIRSLPILQSMHVGSLSENFPTLRRYCGNGSKFKLLGLNKPFHGALYRTRILQSMSTRTGQRTTDSKSSKLSNHRHEFLDGTVKASTIPDLSCFQSIQYCDDQRKILESQDSNHLVRLFVIDIDIETTGFCRENGRIFEIAIRDLLGGENSCFQTLVNPEQNVPNSNIHGITTNMVNHPDVPRMEDLIPIIFQYIKSRQIPGGLALFIAHNARCFDVPFLIKEFSRCSMDIPSDWLFLDTLPLARQLMKLHGSKPSSKISLQALREYYEIPVEGSTHRAMSDVNILLSILERMTFNMKLTITDLLERSVKAADLVNLKKNKKKS